MDCSKPGFPVLLCLPEFAQIHVHWVGDAIWPTYPLSPPSPLGFYLSCIGIFCNESALHIRWPKYWSFSFNISPSNEYSGLISFRMDWLDLLAVQGTLKSLLQHHNSKASILCHSEPLTSYAKEIGWENYSAASIGNFLIEMKVWSEELNHSKPLPNKSLIFFN